MPFMPLGPWHPDLAPHMNANGLNRAVNLMPAPDGYRAVRGLSALTGATALDLHSRGSLSGIDSGGVPFIFAGDQNKLYRQGDAGMVDVSKSGGYTLGADDKWSFAQFGDTVFAATNTELIQSYRLGSTGLFADVAGSPKARHLGVVDTFLVAGNIYDSRVSPSTLPHAISWSAVNNPFFWPDPTTDAATAVQANRVPLQGEGAWVQAIVAGAEVGLVFQEHAIWRMDYRSGRDVFDITRVSAKPGLLIHGAAVAFDRNVFYIAEDGFRVHDYSQSVSIGKGRTSRFFLEDFDTSYPDRVTVVKDPDVTVIHVSYPGDGNTSGRPNRIISWDYELDRYGYREMEHDALIANTTETVASLDAPASTGDPDDLGDNPPGDPESVGGTSFDDRISDPGASKMGAFSTTFVASDFTGTWLEGTAETGDIEIAPERFSSVQQTRPRTEGRQARMSIAANARPGGPMAFSAPVDANTTGWCPTRAKGSAHRFRMHLPAGWEQVSGFDIKARPAGRS